MRLSDPGCKCDLGSPVRETCTPGSEWGDGYKGHAGSVRPLPRKGQLRRGSAKATAPRPVPTSHTISHAALLNRVRKKVADNKVLGRLEAFLTAKVMETVEGWTPEEGTPQGAVISPLLSNIYLDPLDHLMAGAGFEMVRYADDFVILCPSEAEARQALERVQGWTATAGLQLHPTKTWIVDATQAGGFDFRGYHFEQGKRWPRRKSLDKLKNTIRAKTRRTNGQSLPVIITSLNRALQRWFGYFKHSHSPTFSMLDKWLRMRLRSSLRKRRGKSGPGRGPDHQPWPKAFFAECGLFSLVTAHATARQFSWG